MSNTNINTQNAKSQMNNQASIASSNNAARIASQSGAATISNGFRNTGAHQLMSYSSCKSFRISANFVQP